eukprot:s1366_g29.t1
MSLQHVVPNTVSLIVDAIDRAQKIRSTARDAVLDLQDDRALRRALNARPRVTRDFKPGDLVAYWRSQKWIKGEHHQEGRWYGTAIVLGTVGRNLVLAHRKQILRCAPEQVRFATDEEKTLLGTPQAELLGIKDLIEGCAFKSQQYVDLIAQSYPTDEPVAQPEPVLSPPSADTVASSAPHAESSSPVPSSVQGSPDEFMPNESNQSPEFSTPNEKSLPAVPDVEPPHFQPEHTRIKPSIPGLDPEAVIEVVGNIYGQNDAPSAWFQTFDKEVRSLGWRASAFDACLYHLRDHENRLVGLLGVHVDDCLLGGMGPIFEDSVCKLRERFPFRKWRIGSEFCGAFYSQDDDGIISMSMKAFAQKVKPASISKSASPEQPLEPHQIKVLRAINGSLNWLSSQARPDIAAQTSLSQQCFPNPKIKHLRQANNIIRRAKQHADLSLSFRPIPLENLTVACHSDAAFANVGDHTQAGFVIGFTDQALNDAEMVPWNPVVWRSFRLSRAVSSTVAAESQAMSIASGTMEWLMLILAELLDGSFSVRQASDVLKRRTPFLITDCKRVPRLERLKSISLGLQLTPESWKQLEIAAKIALPEKVQSAFHWSQTMITFGKLKSLGLCYLELALSRDEDQIGYVKWIREHVHEGSSFQLKDLAKFLDVFNEMIPSSGSSKLTFAGTSIERRFKVQ